MIEDNYIRRSELLEAIERATWYDERDKEYVATEIAYDLPAADVVSEGRMDNAVANAFDCLECLRISESLTYEAYSKLYGAIQAI